MIGRFWRGRTTTGNAAAYADLLRTTVLPGIDRIAGYRGAYLFRRHTEDGVEFVTLTLFESIEAVKAFAGEDYETAVILPAAHELLAEHDPTARHYEVVLAPEA